MFTIEIGDGLKAFIWVSVARANHFV